MVKFWTWAKNLKSLDLFAYVPESVRADRKIYKYITKQRFLDFFRLPKIQSDVFNTLHLVRVWTLFVGLSDKMILECFYELCFKYIIVWFKVWSRYYFKVYPVGLRFTRPGLVLFKVPEKCQNQRNRRKSWIVHLESSLQKIGTRRWGGENMADKEIINKKG